MRKYFMGIIGFAGFLAAVPSEAQVTNASGFSWVPELGLRGGFSSTTIDHPFTQVEIYADWGLCKPWSLGREWSLKPAMELSCGWLQQGNEGGFVGTLGPVLFLRRERFPIVFEVGVRPTGLSRDEYPCRDLGFLFQFTSHVGFGWEFAPGWKLSYRLQHTSNAGFGDHNPGLNMNMFGIGWQF